MGEWCISFFFIKTFNLCQLFIYKAALIDTKINVKVLFFLGLSVCKLNNWLDMGESIGFGLKMEQEN